MKAGHAVAAAVIGGTALIQPVAAEPIRPLAVTPLHIGSIDYFRVVASTPIATGHLNRLIADSAGALGALARSESAHRISCEIGIATEALVSWKCVRQDDGSASAAAFAYYLDNGQLRQVTPATLFAPRPDLAAELATLEGGRDSMASYGGGTEVCHPALSAPTQFVTADGIEFQNADHDRCLVTWEALAPLLAADGPTTRLAADEAPAESSAWSKAAPRFVALPAPDDAVLDKVTGLVWAARDNGADIAWQAATAYARDHRGGGHADWRLPTEAELEALAEPEMAHREPGDCTRGRINVAVTALIHPSCGLAWTSTTLGGDRAVAFGFGSATSRIAWRADRKHYRALVVRDQGSSARSGATNVARASSENSSSRR
jgi:hypothetical protein